jgi:hypothetical protein
MTSQAPSISWPLRDSWEATRQPKYPDGSLSNGLSNFASPAEIDELIRALQRLHETQVGIARRRVTEAIKKLRNNELPYVTDVPEAKRLLEPLRLRRQDMHELYKRAWSQHRNERPVDDAAWEAELRRRAAIENAFASAWASLLKTSRADADNEAA